MSALSAFKQRNCSSLNIKILQFSTRSDHRRTECLIAALVNYLQSKTDK